ncbi:MAG TPA: L-serine ammonia-lyase [Planctomycetaceae bacterium]|nr:L-serine ammonia-lyase [Planctomycetaceae bacterium]
MNSIFELFKVGVGPSSSHTVGPMIAAQRFASDLLSDPQRSQATHRIRVDLYGSLALTGRGHATDSAVIAGLCGLKPGTVEPQTLAETVARVRQTQHLALSPDIVITFDEPSDLVFNTSQSLPFHPNGVRFSALDAGGNPIFVDQYYSVGGGFVVSHAESQHAAAATSQSATDSTSGDFPFPFTSSAELIDMCDRSGLSIDEIVNRNELVHRSQSEIDDQLDLLWDVMRQSIERGCRTEGILPGGLKVRRRAPAIHQKLIAAADSNILSDPLNQLDHVSLYALAVNEENAAGGKVVTAPTNGAAGVIPAVMMYYLKFYPDATVAGGRRWLKTAGAIGLLYKRNASLSAAEMGCQGEVGVACSMAAAGLAACMGGTPRQVANAAEIGMEHNLGLTCDPVGGLVQIPCIERNTMGATKAINAARLAVLYGDGSHQVSLDRVIETMRQTGVDMQSKYKETSLGGLAVNVVNC